MHGFSTEQMADMNNFYSFNRSYLKRNQIEFKAISNIDYSSFKPLDSSTIYYKNPTFTWDPVPGADGYIFQLSRNDIFTAVLKTVYLKTPFYQTDSLVLGKNHYWRIKPLNAFIQARSKVDKNFMLKTKIQIVSFQLPFKILLEKP